MIQMVAIKRYSLEDGHVETLRTIVGDSVEEERKAAEECCNNLVACNHDTNAFVYSVSEEDAK